MEIFIPVLLIAKIVFFILFSGLLAGVIMFPINDQSTTVVQILI